MTARDPYTTTPTTIDRQLVADFNRGTRRAIVVNRAEFVCRCGVSTITERGLRRHEAKWCKS